MSNLATIVNNILADSGIDDINVVVTNGSYNNPAWITALAWTKITGTPTTLGGYGITDAVPSNRTITINGLAQDLSANRSWTINTGVASVSAGTGISVAGTADVVITNTGVLSVNGSTGNVTGIATTAQLAGYLPLSGGTMTGKTLAPSFGDDVYGGAFEIRERNYVLATQSAWSFSPAISFHWGNRAAIRFGLRADGFMAVDDQPIVIQNGGTWGISITGNAATITGQANSATITAATAATANTIVLRDGGGDIYSRYSFSSYVNTSDNDESGITRFVIKNGDNYHRSATTTVAADIIRGVASGTWGINITGNAATATSSNSIQGVLPGQIVYGGASSRQGVNQISDWNQSTFASAAFLSSESSTTNAPTTDFTYGVQTSFHRGSPEYRTQFVTSLYGNNVYWLRQLRDSAGWSAWVQILHSGNFNSYAPALGGAGAFGTWEISIVGNAGSVTNGVYTTGNQTIDGVKTFSSTVVANRYAGVNSLILNNYTTVNPSSNVFLYSQPNDRDAWIFLDSADTGSNWGLYHRQIDSAVGGLPGNSIGFIGGGASTLQAYISLANGDAYFRGTTTIGGNISAANLSGTNTGDQTNISGSATSLNSNNFIARNGETNYNTSFEATPAGTARYIGDVANGANGPGNTWWVVQNFRHSNAGSFWGTQIAWGWEDNANRLATRNVTNGNYGAWVYYLNSANFNSYAPTLTGGGASGTWAINISGNAATATNATNATNAVGASNLFLTSLGTGSVNVNNGSTAVYRNENGNGGNIPYSPVLHVGGSDTMWQIQGTYGETGNGTLYFRQGYAGSWGNWLTMLSSSNFNSYAPTLTGGGASGTWAINISGNASSATNASNSNTVANLTPALFFNNMGQPHSAYNNANNVGDFGARYLNSPATNGPNTGTSQYYGFTLGLGADYAVDNYASQFYWPRTPIGGNPYVSVRFNEGGTWGAWSKIWAGYADSAGSVAWTNVSGRPTALSAFTNDTGFISNSSDAFPSIPRTNFIVTLTAAEYAALSPKQTDTLYVVV